ncbi:MAG TPA: prolipoprotein diacylglyceryl transferase [Acidimicrobiia bacterium]|nr:prolipoprotein diacylglyceryl transferase [Acidimicrobiia bacterium]
MMVGSIPSPSNGTVHLGPLPIHVYGVLLAIGVVVAATLAERRWASWGRDRRELAAIWIPVVIAGVVGARLYHVATDYQLFEDNWGRVFQIWKGGLSIWGTVLGGGIAVYVMSRIRRLDFLRVSDAIAPGLLVAQALGRWGNYFNQELFGKPTTLPWGLEIDPAHRPAGYTQYATFQPTFLYESLYCLAALALLLWAERRFRLHRGQVFALYVVVYTFGRFWFEMLRIDPAHHVAGLRINDWVSIGVFIAGFVYFMWLGKNEVTAAEADAAAAAARAGELPAPV